MKSLKIFSLLIFLFTVSCNSNLISLNNSIKSNLCKVPFNIQIPLPNFTIQSVDRESIEGLRITILDSNNNLKVFDNIDISYLDNYKFSKVRKFYGIPNILDVNYTDTYSNNGIYEKSDALSVIVTNKSTTKSLTQISGVIELPVGNNNVIKVEALTFKRNSLGKILKADGTLINNDGILRRDSEGYIIGDKPAFDFLQGIEVMGYFDVKSLETPAINVNWGRTPVAKIISLFKENSSQSIKNLASSNILTEANRTLLQNKINTAVGWAGDDKILTFTIKEPVFIDYTTYFNNLTASPVPSTEAELNTRINTTNITFINSAIFKGKLILKKQNGTPLANTQVKLWFGDITSQEIIRTSDSNGIIDFNSSPITNITASNSSYYTSQAPVYKLQAEILNPGLEPVKKGTKAVSYTQAINISSITPDTSTIEIMFPSLTFNNGYRNNNRLVNKFNGTANNAVSGDLVYSSSDIDDVVKQIDFPLVALNSPVTNIDYGNSDTSNWTYITVDNVTGFSTGQIVIFDSNNTVGTQNYKKATISNIDTINKKLSLNNIKDTLVFNTTNDNKVELAEERVFNFKGIDYKQVWIHSNGALEFTNPFSNPSPIYPLTRKTLDTEFKNRNIIAPLWADLVFNAAGEGVFFRQADSNHITFLWIAKPKGQTNQIRFEVTLTYNSIGNNLINPYTHNVDGKGYIEFSYGNGGDTLIYYPNFATIGINGVYSELLQPNLFPTQGIKILTSQESLFFYN